MAVLERAPQAVVDQRVDDLAVAHPESFANAWQQVGRVAHRFHAAGDRDVDVASRDALSREHDGFQSRPAHLVDRQRGNMVGEAAVERRLARRILSVAGLDDVAHDALVDRRGIDSRPPNRFAHDLRAELGGGEILQHAKKPACWRADGRDDDGFTGVHGCRRFRRGSGSCSMRSFVTDSGPRKC